jgi:hypothetical protein
VTSGAYFALGAFYGAAVLALSLWLDAWFSRRERRRRS